MIIIIIIIIIIYYLKKEGLIECTSIASYMKPIQQAHSKDF